MDVCHRPDYLEAVYDNKRRNRFPQPSCDPGYNWPAEAYCSLSPAFVAQPFLTFVNDDPSDDGAGSASVKDDMKNNNTFSRKQKEGPFTSIVNAMDDKFGRPRGSSLPKALPIQKHNVDKTKNTPFISSRDGAWAAMDAGTPPWAATSQAVKELYRTAGCEPCELTLSCGNGLYGEACAPLATDIFSKDKSTSNVPVLQMPHMDRSEYADGYYGESKQPFLPYTNRTPISALDAAGSNNPFLSRFSKLVFQTEAERLRTQYNMGVPPFPKPCPPTPVGVAPRFDPPPLEAQHASPIVIDREILNVRDDCGCNRSECYGNTKGTTCARSYKHPQSVAGIYARQSH